MKKTLSILLIVSILLLSSCQIGRSGKAVSTGDTKWVEVFQCYQHQDVYRQDFFLSKDPNCEGKVLHQSIGYFAETPIPGYEMQQISQCQRYIRQTVSKALGGKEKKQTFKDLFAEIGDGCPPQTDLVNKLGYVFKNKPAPTTFGETTQYYRCWMDRWNENVWDHWVSSNPACYSDRLQRNVNAEFSIGWVRTGAAPATIGPSPIISECDQARQTNADLKAKIAAAKDEITKLQAQIASVR